MRKLAFLEPSADLRERWQYNNLMYLTAGYLIEVITGRTWEDVVRTRVLTPLDMTRSNFAVTDSQKDADHARPYAKRDGKVMEVPFRNIGNAGPAGSINSSVNEMAHWVIANLNGGRYGDKQIAEAATINEMHVPQMAMRVLNLRPDISSMDYALGWLVDTYRGHQRVQHGGNIDGFSANVVLFPKDGLGIVVLTNMNATPLCDLIAQVIADRVFKLEPVDWLNTPTLIEAAMKEGEAQAAATRVAGTQPAHKLEDYVGDYEHPGYGVLKVALRDGRLEATYNNMATPLEHWHYETFNGGKGKEVVLQNRKFNFQTDVKGLVAKVSASFEPSVNDIVFARKPVVRLFEAAYLARFTGEYDLLGQTIKVGLKGNKLTAQVAGQSGEDLLPGIDGDFTLKLLDMVVSLHFVTDASDKVTAVEMRLRGMVLTAKRKP